MAPSQVRNWEHSGSDCCSPISSCFLGWCCPCFLYGKVYHRTRKDSSMKDFSWCNGSCCGYYVIAMCGCHWILQMMQRGEMRSKYQLQGGGCKDCLCACCCTPCDLVQQDKEAEFRENEKRSLITQ
ncbi:PLAC8-domain-containing protein, partial [Eremomyces bilateralis CBS 781.70]